MENTNCKNCGSENKTNAKYCANCGYELPKRENSDEKVFQPATSKSEKRNKTIGIVVGAIVFGISSVAVQQLFFNEPGFDKIMMHAASEINKSCPIMVDQYTRLDNAMAMPNNSLQYNYTLVTLTKEEVNPDSAKKYLEPGIINNIKTSPDLKTYRDHKTTMIYNYRDKNGVFVYKLSVTPAMYK